MNPLWSGRVHRDKATFMRGHAFDATTAMSASSPNLCPKCGGPMETGFLYFDYHRTSWLRERPQHFWQGDFSDHLGPSTSAGLIDCPGARCRECHLVLFEYPPER